MINDRTNGRWTLMICYRSKYQHRIHFEKCLSFDDSLDKFTACPMHMRGNLSFDALKLSYHIWTWKAFGMMHERQRIIKINLLVVPYNLYGFSARTMQAEQITQLFLGLGWLMIVFQGRRRIWFVCSLFIRMLACLAACITRIFIN